MAEELKPCPFCGQALFQKSRKHNPYACCQTEGCKGSKLPLLNLDMPDDIAAWNTRDQLPSQGREAVNVAGIRISTDGFGSYIADSTMGVGPAFPGEVRDPLMTVAQHNRIMAAAKPDTELVELLREVLGSISYEQHYGLFGRIKAKLAELQK